jgi:hypothetical protein
MRDPAFLLIHLIATIAKLLLPGGTRSIIAESLLLKHQLLILNRSRARAPNLRPFDRVIAGMCTDLMRRARLIRAAIVVARSDVGSFTARLQPYSAEAADADAHLASCLQVKKKEGLRVGVLKQAASVWAFICDSRTGQCTYQLASRR